MSLTIDTDVVVAAMRSPTGASVPLLTLLLEGKGTWLLSVAMALEYESICMLADHRLAAGASEGGVRNLLNSIFGIIVPVEVHYQWRPQLSDASDEMVLETAVNGQADTIVSFNHADYKDAPRRSRRRKPISLRFAARGTGRLRSRFCPVTVARRLVPKTKS